MIPSKWSWAVRFIGENNITLNRSDNTFEKFIIITMML